MKKNLEEILQNLENCEIFKGISKDFIMEILKEAKIENYKSKEIVRYRGDDCDEILILVEGEAYGLFTNTEGRVLQIDHMLAPKLLASAVIFSTDAKYPVDVETVRPSIFVTIGKDTFVKYLMKNETLLRNYLRYVSDAFIFITDKFYEVAMKNLVQKVCSYLLKLSEEQNSLKVTMDMSKEELAREFGVTRPALSRVFIELEKQGIINVNNRIVEIIDEDYIRNFAEFG
ncbi:Crp/Fnr family transcriptional regulator, partial [Fervidobacterium sp. SC_NGM5_G05]